MLGHSTDPIFVVHFQAQILKLGQCLISGAPCGFWIVCLLMDLFKDLRGLEGGSKE